MEKENGRTPAVSIIRSRTPELLTEERTVEHQHGKRSRTPDIFLKRKEKNGRTPVVYPPPFTETKKDDRERDSSHKLQ
ncbi:hypothetical protein PROFUN_12127 [Planoprotostelium fungivorum]|uniref:Uncharacterized protein n=1 Tax=Planoprotostelium fungivorum TaxID=1890364 RepID=A0A2P6N895_9EUKA|nr:hypothetical protein PROFUN_12127 [Planoprotostelium fungivorum]